MLVDESRYSWADVATSWAVTTGGVDETNIPSFFTAAFFWSIGDEVLETGLVPR
jgi:hypothetical protein